jgi:hypothetical protein
MTRSLDTGMPDDTRLWPMFPGGSVDECRTEYTARKTAQTASTDAFIHQVRRFNTGATRDLDTGKFDYEAFLSPLVIERYGAYMHSKRQINGQPMRDGDNWQRGIPLTVYMKSMWRHFVDLWKEHRGVKTQEGIEDALCAVIFNASGYLHEHLKAQRAPATCDHTSTYSV